MQNFPCAVCSFEHTVYKAGLVFEQQMGEEIAIGGKILSVIKALVRLDHLFGDLTAGHAADQIPPVICQRALTGDVPTAEALVVRDLVPRLFFAERIKRPASWRGDHRLQDKAGNVTRISGGMAVHASLGSFHLELFTGARNRENIKYSAQIRIERNDFDFTARDKADIQLFVKIKSARIFGRYQVELQAGG